MSNTQAQVQPLTQRNQWHTSAMSAKTVSRADDPNRQADAVMRAARVLVGVVAKSVAEVEHIVSLPQLRVLVLVASRGQLNLGQVAEALGVHPSNATRTVDRLVVAGLLGRAEDPGDRRYLILELTGTGHDLVQRVMEYRRSSILAVMENMSASRRRTLAAALEAFAEAAGEPFDGEEAYVLGLPD
jgi:DNA-binding MarR family transcriptional regulator